VDAQEPQDAHPLPERPKPQPAALRTVAYAFLAQSLVLHLEPDAATEFRIIVAQERKMEPQAAQQVPQAESESALVCSPEARSAQASSSREKQARSPLLAAQ